jgi:hypothetical protein
VPPDPAVPPPPTPLPDPCATPPLPAPAAGTQALASAPDAAVDPTVP